MLLQFGDSDGNRKSLGALAGAAAQSTRETDVAGWYEEGSILGIIFTELGLLKRSDAMQTLRTRIQRIAASELRAQEFRDLTFSLFLCPANTAEDVVGEKLHVEALSSDKVDQAYTVEDEREGSWEKLTTQ